MARSAVSPARAYAVVLALLLTLLPSLTVADLNNWACLVGGCTESTACGVYRLCGTSGKISVSCNNCSTPTPTSAPKKVCNFQTFRCETNDAPSNGQGVEGAPCFANGNDSSCGPDLDCRPDHSEVPSKTGHRCCWKKCPPGACGGKNLLYTNACGDTYICKETC